MKGETFFKLFPEKPKQNAEEMLKSYILFAYYDISYITNLLCQRELKTVRA